MKASEAVSVTCSVLSGMTRVQREALAKVLISDGLTRETRPAQIRATIVAAVNEQAASAPAKPIPTRNIGDVLADMFR